MSSENNDRKDVHHHKETQKSSGQELESTEIDNLEECEIRMHAVSLPTFLLGFLVRTNLTPLSASIKVASSGTAVQQSSETVSQVKPVSDTSSADVLDASQSTVPAVVNHKTEKEAKASLDFHDPMVNNSDHTEAVPEKHGDTIAEEKFEKDLKDSGNWKHLYMGHPAIFLPKPICAEL